MRGTKVDLQWCSLSYGEGGISQRACFVYINEHSKKTGDLSTNPSAQMECWYIVWFCAWTIFIWGKFQNILMFSQWILNEFTQDVKCGMDFKRCPRKSIQCSRIFRKWEMGSEISICCLVGGFLILVFYVSELNDHSS